MKVPKYFLPSPAQERALLWLFEHTRVLGKDKFKFGDVGIDWRTAYPLGRLSFAYIDVTDNSISLTIGGKLYVERYLLKETAQAV